MVPSTVGSFVGATDPFEITGLAFAPDGTLYGTDFDGAVYTIDPLTGAATEVGWDEPFIRLAIDPNDTGHRHDRLRGACQRTVVPQFCSRPRADPFGNGNNSRLPDTCAALQLVPAVTQNRQPGSDDSHQRRGK